MKRQMIKKRTHTSARLFQAVFAFVFIFSLLGVQPAAPVMAEHLEAPSAQGGAQTKVALITDFGVNISDSLKSNVAGLITAWAPDAVVTAGDNYHDRSPSCGSYAECVAGYNGHTSGYTDFVGQEKFFPAYGNHDAMHASAYTTYFSYLPSNPDSSHRYYDVKVGNIHFWFLNGNENLTATGNPQAAWLSANAPDTSAAWNVVIVHQPPYGTGTYGDISSSQLPYHEYGIDFVVGGHNHHYERLEKEGVVYYIAGFAGNCDHHSCGTRTTTATSKFCSNEGGYMQLIATNTQIDINYINQSGTQLDTFTKTREAPSAYAWEAFNDCVEAGPSGTTNPDNTTTIKCFQNGSGTLKNFATGSNLDISATVATSGSVDSQTSSTLWGELPNQGTDAANLFNGKASIYGGVRLYSNKQSKVDLTISGLDPEKTYTFATTANRGVEDNANRKTGFTLSDVESAVNRSSSGTEIDGLYTKFSTGYNTVNGYVARWENISPGSDGDFVVTFTNQSDGTETTSYGPAVFYLAEEIGDAETYTLTVTDDGNGSVELSPPGGVYYKNQTVTLTPKPNPGFAFSHWSGDDAGDIVYSAGKYTIVMDDDKSVKANFEVSLCTTVSLVTTGDTYLRQGYPKRNYGGTTTISMSDHTSTAQGALFKWDLSEISTDVIVESASLSFYVTDASKTAFNLYNLKREWVEGTSNDAESTTSANWNTYDGKNNWGTGGAANTTSDRDEINLWDATGGTGGTFSQSGDVTIPLNAEGIAVVQGWVDKSLSNYGFTVQNYTTTAKDYWIVASKENTSSYTKPTLNITYCMPSTDPTIITSVSALEPFHTQPGIPSEAQTYTVAGVNLENKLIITAPEGFVLSIDGTTYNSELELTPSGEGAINETVYVRLTGANEGVFSGNITHTSIGAAQKDVAVSGSISSEICVTSRISLKSDDVEERMNTGSTNGDVDLDGDTSTKALQMYRAYGGSTTDLNWWGLRFQNVDVPEGATITSADITFRAIANSGATASGMTLWGQADDNPATFTTAKYNVSSRAKTTASVAWSVPQWTNGEDYVTPDLADVIQEIVDRPGWAAKNAIAILGQTTVSQNRSATSFDSSNGATLAPQLEVCYTMVDPRNINKAVDKDEAGIGETLTYTISDISYAKNDLLTNVTVTDAIPDGTNYVTDSASPAATLGSGVLTWSLGSNTAGVPGEVIEGSGQSGVIVEGAPTTAATTTNSTSLTFNHATGPGSNRLLVVGIASSGNTAVSSVKFDGVSLTSAGTNVYSTVRRGSVYYLIDPPASKTAQVEITMAGSVGISAGAINFANVEDVKTAATQNAWEEDPSITVTTDPDDLVLGFLSLGNYDVTDDQAQTRYWLKDTAGGTFIRGVGSIKLATSTSTTLKWTAAKTAYATIALPIEPAAGGSTRTTTLKAANSLVSAGDTVTVEAVFTNTQADTAVAAGTLKYVLTGDILPEKVACTPVGATSGNISAGGALTVTYECTVDTDKIGSIAFKLDAKSEDNQYPEGLSNSVLIVPELSFQVTVDASAEDEIENIAYLNSTNFEPFASEPAVTAVTEAENTPITSAALTITAPEAGATPAGTATLVTDPDEAASVKSVSWDPSDIPFGYDMAYTVTVVLEVKAGFEFTGATTAKVNDEAATIASWSAGTLTATYTFPKTAAEMHTVTFDANGGSGTMEAQEANIPTALKKNAFERTGYTFAGWNTKADGTGTAYADEATYDFTADLTLYAQWTANAYTLAINISGNGSVTKDPDKETYSYGDEVELTAIPDDGYSFLGWGGDLDGDTNPVTLTMDENKVVEASFSSETAPPLPSNFYGKILYVEGDGVPEVDDLVQAYLDNMDEPICSTKITTDASQLVYAINVKAYPNGTLPTKVTFKIDGRVVAIANWNTGTSVLLDFHPPKADTGGPYVALLDDESIDLLGSVTDRGNDVESYVWALDGDGVFDDAPGNLQPTFAFDATGAYPISLMSVDEQGGQGFGDSLVFVITVDGLSQVYDGSPKSVSVSELTGYDIVVLYNGSTTPPTDAGSYPVTIQIKKDNVTLATYDAGNMVIGKASAQVTLGNLTHTYDGTAKAATASTVPAGLKVIMTYNPEDPVNAGSYAVTATIDEDNYVGTTSGTLVIAKATATITLANLTHTYDGTTKAATASTVPAGLKVNMTYNPEDPVNAGSYAVTATIDDINYEGTASGTLIISKATPTIITNPTASPITEGQSLADSTLSGGVASVPGSFAWKDGTIVPALADSGTTLYKVVFTPTDTDNYNTVEIEITIIVNPISFTHEIDLVAGWNLVSFNIHPSNTNIEAVLASIDGKYTLVYAWDATGGHSGSGHWMRYAAGVIYGNSLETLDETQGFWIFMTEAATLEVTGTAPDMTEISLKTTVGGWNLVGYPSSLKPTPPTLMGEINYKLIMTYIASDTADPWKLYDPAAPGYANDLVEMLPGYGYWIFVNVADILEVPFN